jgi:mycothiol synthase
VYVRQTGEALVDGVVRPVHRGRGVATSLHDPLERHAAAANATRLRAVVTGENPSAHAFFAGRGYRRALRTWQMSIEFDAAPPPASFPAGVTVRTVERGRDDRALYDLVETAFADQSPERQGISYDEWASLMLGDDVDLSLYFLAERDGEPVGAVLCPWYLNAGWVRQLAVRADQRGQGLGFALLGHAFAALYARGHRRVGLGVDEWNQTGALRLYERAGMLPVLEHQWYERAPEPA